MIDIAETIDQWFLDNREEREPDGKLHPSSMSGCWRQAVYEAQGVEPTDEKAARNYRIMWFGTKIHEVIQDALGGLPSFRAEVEVAPQGWPMTGSADIVYETAIGSDDEELLELKSISPFALKKKDLPQVHHVEQARMYMWGLRKMGDPIERARIVYVSRDDMAIREFPVERDLEWEHEFEESLTIAEALYLGGKDLLPPRLREDADTRWLCNYCVYKTRCWEQDDDVRKVEEDG